MSFKVSKIVIGKGKTTSDEEQGEWVRRYYEVEAIIEDERNIEVAKGSIEALLDMWLSGESVSEPESTWNPDNIKWEQSEGSSGPYEKSTDFNNPEFKVMLKDLQAHKGKLSKAGLFYWVFQDGATVGRKKREKQSSKVDVDKISGLFPEDLRGLLAFDLKGDACIIRPRQFLGSENFAKIAAIVKEQGGDYISAGKESHFKIPLK